MSWYVNANGQTFGPVDEAQVIAWIHSGRLIGGTACPVGSQQWIDLAAHPPFAAALYRVAPPPPPPGVMPGQPFQARPAAFVATSKPMNPWLKLALFVLVLVIVSFSVGVLGLLLGMAMIGVAEFARRTNRVSFVSWVLKKPPSEGQCIASLAIGATLFVGGGVNVIGTYLGKLANERSVEARQAAEAKRRTDLAAQVPQRVAEWRARLAQVQKLAESPEFLGGGEASVDAVTAAAATLASDVGTPVPPELAQIKTEAVPVRARYAARAEFEGAVREAGEQVQAGKDQAAARKYMAADLSYASALGRLDTIGKADPWLVPFLPAGFDKGAKQKEIESLRAQIAGPLAVEKRKQENEDRLVRVTAIASAVKSDDRASYVQAKAHLGDEAKACGRCPAAPAIAKAAREIDTTLKEWPIDLASIEEMKNRYADLRGRRVRVKGKLSASTYYNCAFASQTDWRGFELSDTVFGGVHVYCSRGDEGCEALFGKLASGGSVKATVVVKYPAYNDVCAEGQAVLQEWE